MNDYKIPKYKPSNKATLCFLIDNKNILLAMKKRGFGKGLWNGTGGKVENGESVKEAAVGETREEICVTPKNLEKVAELNFYFVSKKEWNQQVTVYTCRSWDGIPKETEEMSPRWFARSKIPIDKVWSDDKYWLPKVLGGKKLDTYFVFDENTKITNYKVADLAI